VFMKCRIFPCHQNIHLLQVLGKLLFWGFTVFWELYIVEFTLVCTVSGVLTLLQFGWCSSVCDISYLCHAISGLFCITIHTFKFHFILNQMHFYFSCESLISHFIVVNCIITEYLILILLPHECACIKVVIELPM